MLLQVESEIEFAAGLLALPAAPSYDYELGHGNPSLNQLAPNMDQQGMILARLDGRDCDEIPNPADEINITFSDLAGLLKRRCQRFDVDWRRRKLAITILVFDALCDLRGSRDNGSRALHHSLHAAPKSKLIALRKEFRKIQWQ